jgi:hypothetical protein
VSARHTDEAWRGNFARRDSAAIVRIAANDGRLAAARTLLSGQVMKTLTGTILSLAAVGLIVGCASKSDDPTPAAGANELKTENSKMDGRVSAGEATPKIAAAECEREMKCKNVGESLKYSSMEHCQKSKTDELAKDFNDDEDCKNGISAKDLDECISKTTEQTCSGASSVVTNMERSAECGSNDLCMD